MQVTINLTREGLSHLDKALAERTREILNLYPMASESEARALNKEFINLTKAHNEIALAITKGE